MVSLWIRMVCRILTVLCGLLGPIVARSSPTPTAAACTEPGPASKTLLSGLPEARAIKQSFPLEEAHVAIICYTSHIWLFL